MPFSGGTYTKWNNASGGWAGDKAAGTGILATRHDSQDDDFATAINSCLTKTGANTPTANISWAGYKLTSLGNATNGGDAVNLGQLQVASGFYLDTVNNRVGINQTSPSEKLDVVGAVRIGASSAPAFDSAMRLWGESGFGNRYDGKAHRWDIGNGPSRVEGMRLTEAGQLGIGATAFSSSEVLKAGDGTTNKWVTVSGANSGTGNGAAIIVQAGGTTVCAMGNDSSINGGTYSGTATLYSTGAWKVQGIASGAGNATMKWNTSTGAWTYDTSSLRYKENVRDSTYGLEAVKALRPREYEFKEDQRSDVGFIAEELFEVIPELAPLDGEGIPLSVSYDRLTAVLCKAVQELAAKIEALEEKINESAIG
jgi:hypothetical protein